MSASAAVTRDYAVPRDEEGNLMQPEDEDEEDEEEVDADNLVSASATAAPYMNATAATRREEDERKGVQIQAVKRA